MSNYDFPCKDCNEDIKSLGCHDICNKYLMAKKEHEDKKAIIHKNFWRSHELDRFKTEMIRKSRRK